jgi:hypothetical protein
LRYQAMSSNPFVQYRSGLQSAGSYQISGIPWTTSSVAPATGSGPASFEFPYVSRFIVIKNTNSTAGTLRVGFSDNGIQNTSNYFTLAKGESFAGEIRVIDLYVMSDDGSTVDFSLVAGLTGIDREQLPNNWSGSAGIG